MVNAAHAWHGRRRLLKRIARIREQGNEIIIAADDIRRIKFTVRGRGNYIRIGKLAPGTGKISIDIFGENCRVEIGDGFCVSQQLGVVIGQDHPNFGKVIGSKVCIGNETSIESATIITFNSHTEVAIGANCMFSFGITLYQTDGHPIYEFGTNKICNIPRTMQIGNHVWVGKDVTILKNAIIPDGCIVGWGSVVSGRFTQPHAIICGDPARQIEGRKVDWAEGDPRYIANEEATH